MTAVTCDLCHDRALSLIPYNRLLITCLPQAKTNGKKYNLQNIQVLENVALGIDLALNAFAGLFLTKTHRVSQKAFPYLLGSFKSEKTG